MKTNRRPKAKRKPKARRVVPVPRVGPIGKLLKDSPYRIEDGVSQSILSAWCSCRVNSRFNLDGWQTGKRKDALVYGSLWHSLLEKFFLGVKDDGLTAADAQDFFDEFIKGWLAKQQKETSNARDIQADEFCAAQAEATFIPYCEYHEDDFIPGRWVELEGVFEVDFHGFKLRGRMDGLQRCKTPKGSYLRLMEHKTKSRIEEDALDKRLCFDFQNLFYLTALNSQLAANGSKERARIVVYDIIRRPGLKYNPDKASLQEYAARVREHVATNKTGGPDHYFKRSEITYTVKDLKRFEEGLLVKLRLFRDWLAGTEPTYRNEQACVAGWNCSFLDACAASGNMAGYEQTGKLFVELED